MSAQRLVCLRHDAARLQQELRQNFFHIGKLFSILLDLKQRAVVKKSAALASLSIFCP